MTDITAADAASLQRDAEALLSGLGGGFSIDTADEYTAVDLALSEVVRRKDAAEAMRKTATTPMRAAIKTVDSWFAPTTKALERAEFLCKAAMAAYTQRQRLAEREAREAAALAASTGGDVVAPLVAAQAAAVAPEGRATTRMVWAVDRIVRALLPDTFLMPDEKAIAAVARAHKGDDPPVIPGVVFKRETIIGARR